MSIDSDALTIDRVIRYPDHFPFLGNAACAALNRLVELAKSGEEIMKAKATEQEGKYKPHLVTEEFIEAIAQVRAYGVKKYGHEDGWQITPDIEYLDAAARHINKTIAALQHGNMSELYDNELKNDKLEGSGLLNLAHAACDIMFIITKIVNNNSELVTKIKAMEEAK